MNDNTTYTILPPQAWPRFVGRVIEQAFPEPVVLIRAREPLVTETPVLVTEVVAVRLSDYAESAVTIDVANPPSVFDYESPFIPQGRVSATAVQGHFPDLDWEY